MNSLRSLRFLLRSALFAVAVLCPMARVALPQTEHPVTGRRIAPVMGVSGADWLNRPGRQREENTERALEELHLRPGMVVGDVGAGTGYFSLKIAKRVAPTGKVYANDIQPQMISKLRANAEAAGMTNVEPVLGTESNPNLPFAQLDLIIMVDVYHELSRPQRMLQQLHAALKPTGELVLLEYRKEDLSVPIRPEHKMSLEEVKAEVEPEGYRFEKSVETLPWQHMVFFRKAPVN
jgi:ubiquinone/menaquinone biosynthesis C-methylase UbiE